MAYGTSVKQPDPPIDPTKETSKIEPDADPDEFVHLKRVRLTSAGEQCTAARRSRADFGHFAGIAIPDEHM
jgi:hypothetical protein